MRKTIMISLIIGLFTAFAVSVSATDVKLGGNFTLKYSGPELKDQSKADWWELQANTYKNFGNGNAYLKAKATPSSLLSITGYGYTYTINDSLSITASNDESGEMLADSRVMAEPYDWKDTLSKINLNNRLFVKQTTVKVSSSFPNSLAGTVAYTPGQYLIKGQFSGSRYKLGGGFTNTRAGYKDGDTSKRPLYDIFAELKPASNVTIYGEYLQGNRYFFQGDYQVDPYKFTVKYGNIGLVEPGQIGFTPETVEGTVTYDFSVIGSAHAGVSWYVTNNPGFGRAFGGVKIGPVEFKANHDFYKEETTLISSYNLDGSNTLVADYNFQTKRYNLSLSVNMW